MSVIPNMKNELSLSRSVFCAFCGMEDAAKHSGPIETTETVTMTLPARAKLNAIVDGLTFRFPFVLLSNFFVWLPLLLFSPLFTSFADSSSFMVSSSSVLSTGWQNTMSAPRHVDMPASVDK